VRAGLLLLAAVGPLLGACAAAPPRPPRPPPPVGAIAVLPVDNASGRTVPSARLLAAVEEALRAGGVEIVTGEAVEGWLAANRMRFTGAVSPAAAGSAGATLGVGAVLVTSVEEYVATGIPRIALGMRLVSADAQPRILWSGSVALAGDDAPGLFALGVVRTMATLQRRALGTLVGSLRAWQASGAASAACAGEARFAPSVRYRSDLLDASRTTIAVLPFVNETPRRRAGDVLSDAFIRALRATGRFDVAEPGAVREALLARRVVMEGGVSLDTARVVIDAIDADLVLAGYVRDLAEDAGGAAPPRVEFTALLLDRRSEEIVWEVSSSHAGDEGVRWFDLGRVRSANDLACRMVASAADLAARGDGARSGGAVAAGRPAPRSPGSSARSDPTAEAR
jgi:TolB-like protein